MVGPFSEDRDLRSLPFVPPNAEAEGVRLMRHPLPMTPSTQPPDPVQKVREFIATTIAMPTPITTFAGMNSAQSGCACLPPDTHGDVGPNHYIQSVNSSIKIFDKSGNALNGTNGTTYNSFFSGLALSGTPCGLNQNNGDGIVFYDQLAGRWVVSDFAFPAFPGVSFYQCIAVSKTSDPVAGGWWLYAIQVDPSNLNYLGDYPKFGLWPDAYYLTMNMFSDNTTFTGVRVIALDRASMINGTGTPNPTAVAFTITPATLGDAYSLVPATFRTGLNPPAGTPEYLLAIDSPSTGGVVQNAVHVWRFHVDFVTPANSTLGLGATHAWNGDVTVNSFTDAFTTTTLLIPQSGTAVLLDTLGDKIMTPVVYQNLAGVESLWISHTINNNQAGTGPTAIRWYQFNVTGSTIPATPAQQQTFNNGADGLWRWMPSLGVDSLGNMAIGYSVSGSSSEPSIRYAGRSITDAANTLGQGEATLFDGGGHQTHSSGRWGDYSGMSIDPSDNLTFWHTSEYFAASSGSAWATGIGTFKFPAVTGTPTPTPTATATPEPTATPTATPEPTATATPEPTATATPEPTATATPGATATATPTVSPTATATATPTVTATATATATPAATATATPTATATVTATATPTSTATATPIPTATATATVAPTATATATPVATATATPTATATATVAPTATATPTPTATATATSTPTPTATATATPTPTATATATPTATPTRAVNLSTRMRSDIGDNAGIGGFIIAGSVPKHVIVRGLGPSLTRFGFPPSDLLADPTLELHGPDNFAPISNNNWRDSQETEIQNSGLAPTNDLESAIDVTLSPGAYTAILRGNDNGVGIGTVEIYDRDVTGAARLANLSTRAFVRTGSSVVIAGFILANNGGNNGNDRIVIRGLGPSLSAFGISNPLQNPTLELRSQNGTLLKSNDDWEDDRAQAIEIAAAGLAPPDPKESAMAVSLPPGPYTAILAGLNDGEGVGTVEVYDRGP